MTPISLWSLPRGRCLENKAPTILTYAAVSIPWLLFLVAVIGRKVVFETNDDPGYLMIAQGAMYGHRSNQLLFIGRPLGFLLTSLYGIAPSIPWYPFLMLISQALSLSLCFLVVLKQYDYRNSGLAIKLIFLGLFGAPLFFSLQFTKASIVVAGCGAIILLLCPTSTERLFKYSGISLVILGFLWRPIGGGLAVLLVWLLWTTQLASRKTKVLDILKRSIPLFMLAALSYSIPLAMWNSSAPWLSSETKEYVKFNSARGQLHGDSYAVSNAAFVGAAKAGLSKNDYELFLNWYFVDREIFTTSTLNSIISGRPVVRDKFELQSSIRDFFQSNIRPMGTLFCLLVALATLTIEKKKLLISLSGGLNLVFGLLVLYFITIFLRMEPRVFFPSLILITLGGLPWWPFMSKKNSVVASPIINQHQSLDVTRIGSILFRVFFVLLSFNIVSKSVESQFTTRISNEFSETYYKMKFDKPIVAFPDFYSPLLFQPFEQPPSNQKYQINLGTSMQSPDSRKQLENLSLSDQLIREIVNGKALVACSEPTLFLIQKFAFEHYRIRVKFKSEPLLSGPHASVWAVEAKRSNLFNFQSQ
jgi:hypothetical protein